MRASFAGAFAAVFRAGVVASVIGATACIDCPTEESCSRVIGRFQCLRCDRMTLETSRGDQCVHACGAWVTCGNGAVDPGERCDDGPFGGTGATGCAPDCSATTCGDGASSSGELCFSYFQLPVQKRPAVGDVDGDGANDVVYGVMNNVLGVLRGPLLTPGPTLVIAPPFGEPTLIRAAGGGAQIVVSAWPDAAVVIELVDGALRLRARISVPAFGERHATVAGDIDNDGDDDVVLVESDSGAAGPAATTILRNQAGELSAESRTACAIAEPALVNLDEDPALELAGVAPDGRFAVCDLTADGFVRVPPAGLASIPPFSFGSWPLLVDIDRDGEVDLLWSVWMEEGKEELFVASGGPALTFQPPRAVLALNSVMGLAADMDLDGNPELIMADATVVRWREGMFEPLGRVQTEGAPVRPESDPSHPAWGVGFGAASLAADVNGDLRPDLVDFDFMLLSAD